MSSKKAVEIHKVHRNEWKSKRNFEDLLDTLNMRMAFPWADNDYGIDGQVELISPIKNSENFRPESKFFLIQLKATENLKTAGKHISFSIPVKKIMQWYSSNVVVMLVINDLKNKAFYSTWIDEHLINTLDSTNSNWVNQGDITLKISAANNFVNYTLDTIRDYVLSWKTPTRKIIEPGIYFELKDTCKKNLDTYTKITKSFNFESIINSLELLNTQIEQAIYRIAITGPSRVGKSTLINALVKRKNISPTGIEQTTAVPIQILPGNEDLIKITFRNGKSIQDKFSAKLVNEYASQSKNEDNRKDVTLVAIYLANRQLEQGVSLFDIPGLDDPDDIIYNYTWNTVLKSNAILYMIDGSVYENGGYIFKSYDKKNILDLGQSLDKIFLVFNKVNALTGNKLELLQTRVMKDLQKLNLYDKVSEKIYFISAEESLNIRTSKKKGDDSVKKLEDDLWAYLLKENKTGLANLCLINKEINNSTKDFEDILKTRLLDNLKRKKLETAIVEVRTKVPELSKLYYERERQIRTSISRFLDNRKNNLLIELERYLKSFPENTELPTKRAMQTYLVQGGHQTLEETNKEYNHQMNQQSQFIDTWIADNLKQVRDVIDTNSKKKIVDFSDIENFESPSIDLSSSFGVGLITGVIALLFAPPIAIIAGISAFFSSLLFSASDRRAKSIMKIMEAARKSYDNQFMKIDAAYMSSMAENSKRIIDYANRKITLFFNDLQNQAKKIDCELSELEEVQYKEANTKIEKLRISLTKLNKEINEWYSSI